MSLVDHAKDEPYVDAISEDALDDSGYVVEWKNASLKVIKHLGANKVYGVAYSDTKDPFTMVAAANKRVLIFRRGLHYVKLSATNAAIIVGDVIAAITGGLVDKQADLDVKDDSVTTLGVSIKAMIDSQKLVVGYAAEAKAQNSGGKILVDLFIIPSPAAAIS